MRRNAFTMIELIFVIVILGILAAVAIPKLGLTRDDAKITKAALDLTTLVGDMGASYTTKGDFNTSTNIRLDTNITSTTPIANYEEPAGTDCVVVTTTVDGNLTLTAATGIPSTICSGIQSILTKNGILGKTNSFGGSSVGL